MTLELLLLLAVIVANDDDGHFPAIERFYRELLPTVPWKYPAQGALPFHYERMSDPAGLLRSALSVYSCSLVAGKRSS